MTFWEIFVTVYVVIGLILVSVWWFDEYKAQHEYECDANEEDEPIPFLLLVLLFLFWPIKVIKDYFESFVD